MTDFVFNRSLPDKKFFNLRNNINIKIINLENYKFNVLYYDSNNKHFLTTKIEYNFDEKLYVIEIPKF